MIIVDSLHDAGDMLAVLVKTFYIFWAVSAGDLSAEYSDSLWTFGESDEAPINEVPQGSFHNILAVQKTTSSLFNLRSTLDYVKVLHQLTKCDCSGIAAFFLANKPTAKQTHKNDFGKMTYWI